MAVGCPVNRNFYLLLGFFMLLRLLLPNGDAHDDDTSADTADTAGTIDTSVTVGPGPTDVADTAEARAADIADALNLK